ncbi:ABC transporter substrate-binding protein [Halobacteriales archaeon QS_8_69_26]|nr:MAG: ABC transporter substrate-binding protein [Halobacteriales archaeon QS_8_69_26]
MSVRRTLYRRFPAVVLARRNLSRNRLRSALSVLGIAIGVLAIATLGMFGNVLQLAAAQSLGGLGNQVIVNPNQDAGVESLSDRDLREIDRAAGEDATVVPVKTGGALVERGSEGTFAQLYGTATPGALFEARSGELPERHRQGVIVGPDVAESLDLRVGSTVEIEGNEYRVVAVLADTDSITPVRPDNAVILPPDEFRSDEFDQAIVQADSGREAAAAADRIRGRLNARQDRVSVFELSSVVSRIDEFFDLLSGFLVGIGAVSLLVAGVSILNIMFVTTVERREEIGVMRAVGIQRVQVLKLVLAEAAVLGAVGSLLGAVASVAILLGLYEFTVLELSVVLHPSNAVYPLVAVAFGLGTSLLSGIYPAYRAATDRPVDALRG